MNGSDLVNVLVAALTGGGIFKAVDSLWTARSMAKKTDAESAATLEKTPAEVDSIVVQGAEQAVLTMQRALTAAQDRMQAMEAEIGRLEGRVRDAEEQALAAVRTIAGLRGELAQFKTSRG